MAQLKAQLEAAGYDTSSLDEAGILAQLDQAGYDTSSLGGNAPGSQPTPQETGLEKAVRYSENVTGTLGKIASPFTSRLGSAMQAIKAKSDEAADKEAELAGQKGVLPISAMIPAIPSMLIDALGVPDRLGTAIAEKGGEYGINPELAAAVGTGVSMAPDIAAGAAGIAKRAAIAGSLKSAAKTATSPLRLAKDLVTKPGAAEARLAGDEALVEVGRRGRSKLTLARETRDAAKKGLIEAEEKAGLHFESTPEFEAYLKDPKKMADFSNRIGRLAKHTPEELAQLVPAKQLQLFRKVAQEGEKISGLSDIANSQMRQGKSVFTEALGKTEKGIGEALGKFRDTEKVVGEIPSEIKTKLANQRLTNKKNVLSAQSLDKKRKVVKSLAKAIAYGLGAKAILK